MARETLSHARLASEGPKPYDAALFGRRDLLVSLAGEGQALALRYPNALGKPGAGQSLALRCSCGKNSLHAG